MRRTTSIALAALGGAISGLACIVVALQIMAPTPLPDLTPSRFQSAWDHWETHGPVNYDIEVSVSGPQAATYQVQVRNGQAVRASRNGYPLPRQRTIGTWSVPGMFNTIEIDLDNLISHTPTQPADTPRLVLHCHFDQKYGYPSRYRRIEIGSRMQVEWQVVALKIVN